MLIVIMNQQHSGDDHPHQGDDPAAADITRLRKEADDLMAAARTMAGRQSELLARLHELQAKIDAHRKVLDERHDKP